MMFLTWITLGVPTASAGVDYTLGCQDGPWYCALNEGPNGQYMDEPNPKDPRPFLDGFLVWGSTPRILWSIPENPVDNQPDAPVGATADGDQEQEAKFRAERHLNNPDLGACYFICVAQTPNPAVGTRLTSPLADDVFQSEPLPRRMVLDVGRGIQLKLFLQSNPNNLVGPQADIHVPCREKRDTLVPLEAAPINSEGRWIEPYLEVQVLANDKVVAAGFPTAQGWWGNFDAQPYGTCPFRMHPEAVVLEAGTVLKLRVSHVLQEFHYKYGFAGDHRSMVRLWEYPTSEVILRQPELMGGAPAPGTEEGATPSPTTSALALGPLVLAGLASAGPLRGRRGATLLVLLAVALGGCIGGGNTDQAGLTRETFAGQVESTQIALGEGQNLKGLGAIVGTVHDQLHKAISDVHVSIVEMTNFTKTQWRGEFEFYNVSAGSWTLRFDHADYKPFQVPVEVKADFAVRPSVTLFPKVDKEGDFRPHSHDYWNGATSKDLGKVVMAPACTNEGPCVLPQTFQVMPTAAEAGIIKPGTGMVEIELEWSKDALGAQRLGLLAQPAGSRWWGWQLAFAPRGPGEPFKIPATWEMTDVGHSRYTTWRFAWFIDKLDTPDLQTQRLMDQPGYNPGNVEAHVSIVRVGALPLEPGHPDQWLSQTAKELLREGRASLPTFGEYPPADYPCLGWPAPCGDVYYWPFGLDWQRGPVPFLTDKVKVTLYASRPTNPAYNVELWYRTAAQPAAMTDANTLHGYQQAQPDSGGIWQSTTYTIKLKAGDADPEYAASSYWGSQWGFVLRYGDATNAYLDQQRRDAATNVQPEPALYYDVDVVAYQAKGAT